MGKKKLALVGRFNNDVINHFMSVIDHDVYDIVTAQYIDHFWTLKQEEIPALAGADYVIIRGKLDKESIDMFPKAKFIVNWGVGTDMIDIPYAESKGISIAVTTGVNSEAVAELTMMLMMTVSRKLLPRINAMKAGEVGKPSDPEGYCIEGKTVGIIGMGNIGRRLRKMVQSCGGKVQYYDLIRLPEDAEKEYDITFVDKETLFRTSDIITMHLPLNDSTWHIIDKKALSMMKPTAVVINTSRGGMVDEPELIRALEEKRILGAGLDVSDPEPMHPDNPLLKMENVVLTPHLGANTIDLTDQMIAATYSLVEKFESKEPLPQNMVIC